MGKQTFWCHNPWNGKYLQTFAGILKIWDNSGRLLRTTAAGGVMLAVWEEEEKELSEVTCREARSFLTQTHERQPSWAFCTRVCKTTGHFLAVTVLRNGYRANKYQTTPNINSTRCFSERFSRAAGLAWMCYLFTRRHRVSIRSQKFPSHKNKLVIFMTSRRCCKISISRGPWRWIRGLWKWVGI